MKKINVDIGDLVEVIITPPKGEKYTIVGTVVDEFLANTIPDPNLVIKYCGFDAHERLYEAEKVDRIVIKYGDCYKVLLGVENKYSKVRKLKKEENKTKYKVSDVVSRVAEYQDKIYDIETILKGIRPYNNWETGIEKDERHSVQILYRELVMARDNLIHLMNTDLILDDIL